MDELHPSDLKSVLHSKRANIYYLEHCRVLVNGGRVEFVTDEGRRSLYWNIPITFRRACIESLARTDALDFMIDTLKAVAESIGLQAA
jgi:CRISPR/Cas system-associated endonuclease Cas1